MYTSSLYNYNIIIIPRQQQLNQPLNIFISDFILLYY